MLVVVYDHLQADGPSAAFFCPATYNYATRTLYYEFSRLGNCFYAQCYVTFRDTLQCDLGRAGLQEAYATSAYHRVVT